MEELPLDTPLEPSLWEIFTDQLNVVLVILAREAVQRQIFTIIVILLISWLIPEALRRWRDRKNSQLVPQLLREKNWWQRLSEILYPLFAPILSLLLGYIAIIIFDFLGYPNGFILNVESLFLIWLAFRLVLAMLYARYDDAVLPYHKWIFTPLLALILVTLTLGRLSAARQVLNFPIYTSDDLTIALSGLIFAGLTLYAFGVFGWIVEQIMNGTLPQRLKAEAGEIQSVATLVRYFIISIGIVVALGIMGFNATSLAIVAGSLLVGIGIGLQEIVANFVSGLTLLFEQSMRPGDIIEIDGRINQVEKISLRATFVRTLDNTELIIPNATFTTAQVENLSRDGRLIRSRIPFGIAYGSDIDHVIQTATEVALKHDLTLSNPPPYVMQKGFGDSSLKFELASWMNQPKLRERYKSDLYFALLKAFSDQKIEIPFPQRDLHIRSGFNPQPAESKSD